MKKPMTDIKFIYHTKSPLTIYKQMHKGNVRLNIDVHAVPIKVVRVGFALVMLFIVPECCMTGLRRSWIYRQYIA